MFCFRTGKCFGKGVGRHVVGGAIDESKRAIFNYIANEMVSDVDVLGSSMEVTIGGHSNSRLVVAI